MIYSYFYNLTYSPIFLNNLIISNCLFLNCISNTDGGGIFLSNSNFNVNLNENSFLNCIGKYSGGSYKITCKNINCLKSCFYKCSTQNYLGYYWGHSGCSSSTNYSEISLITVTYCTYSTSFQGHFVFGISNGHQFGTNLNISKCITVSGNSAFFFGVAISAKCQFGNFINISNKESLIFSDHCQITSVFKCNLIENSVSSGALASYGCPLIVNDTIFLKNSIDLFIFSGTSGSFKLFNCISDKSNFGSVFTFNCLTLIINTNLNKISIFPILECNYLIKTINQNFKIKNILFILIYNFP